MLGGSDSFCPLCCTLKENTDRDNGRIEADKEGEKSKQLPCGSFGTSYHKRANQVSIAVV